MAVKETPKQIRQFVPALKKTALIQMFVLNSVVAGFVAVVLLITGVFEISSIALWFIVIGVLVLNSIVTTYVISFTTQPTSDLLAAVIHIAGEPTTTTPPNPNDGRFRNSGLKTALQTMYELGGVDATAPSRDKNTVDSTGHNKVLQAALDGTTAGFIVMNHERIITFANKAAPVQITPDGSSHLGLLFNGSDTLDAWLDECDTQAVHAEHVWNRIPDRLPEDENRRFFDIIASYEKGSAHEVVLTLIDRTAIYSPSEQELDFIAFAAHELRGPITVIRGYLDVLEDELSGVLADDQHELFRRLTVSANKLSSYINNILNTSRYDRRHLKLHLSEDSLSGIYETIRDDMELRATAQNRLLSVDIPADLPTIAADRASISEVLGNLIDNAIKYSNDGGVIAVTASVKNDMIEVAILDHGIGMPGNVVGNLFQKFYRSHRSRETVAGTGIGLYISKAIVESHGGTIAVRSQEGVGSLFTVALPIYATVAAKLQSGENNAGLIEHGDGWIKNHSMYRG